MMLETFGLFHGSPWKVNKLGFSYNGIVLIGLLLICHCNCQITLPDDRCETAACDLNQQFLETILGAVNYLQHENLQLRQDLNELKSIMIASNHETLDAVRSEINAELQRQSPRLEIELLQREIKDLREDIRIASRNASILEMEHKTILDENTEILNEVKLEIKELKNVISNVTQMDSQRTILPVDNAAEIPPYSYLTANLTRLSKSLNNSVERLISINCGPREQSLNKKVTDPAPVGISGNFGPIAPDQLNKEGDPTAFRDCSDISDAGHNTSGIYLVKPNNATSSFFVYCDINLKGAWTVFQRREDGNVDFYRNWTEYKYGFGNLDGEFWLGNEKIHKLTSQGIYKLGIEMWDWRENGKLGNRYFAKADTFHIGNESAKYTLYVPSDYYQFSGFGGSGLRTHRGPFVTYDRNNLFGRENCAEKYHCGWWFKACVTNANLNGRYYQGGFSNPISRTQEIDAVYWPNINQSLKKVVMKIQRKSINP